MHSIGGALGIIWKTNNLGQTREGKCSCPTFAVVKRKKREEASAEEEYRNDGEEEMSFKEKGEAYMEGILYSLGGSKWKKANKLGGELKVLLKFPILLTNRRKTTGSSLGWGSAWRYRGKFCGQGKL